MVWDIPVYDLPYSSRKQLCNTLDVNGKWRDLAGRLGYSQDEIAAFGLALHRLPGYNSPTDELLSDWGHSCPTIHTLHKHLKSLQLKKAADIIHHYVKAEEKKKGVRHGCQRDSSNSRYTPPLKLKPVGRDTDSNISGGHSSDSESETEVLGHDGFQDLPGPPSRIAVYSRENNTPTKTHPTTSDTYSNDGTLLIRSNNNHTQSWNNFNNINNSPYGNNQTQLLDMSVQPSQYQNPVGPPGNYEWQVHNVTNHQPPVWDAYQFRMPHPSHCGATSYIHTYQQNNIPGYTSSQRSQGISHHSSYKPQLMLNENKPTSIMTSISALEHTHKFQYEEIKKASYGFDEEMLVGKGGFGEVYKGVLTNTEFAIKRLLPMYPVDESLKMKYMTAEVEYLLKFRHKNLIPLTGYSADGPELCLVYEYMVNGSLEDRLKDNEKILSPVQRCYILQGAASGIQYLHNLSDKPLIHGDIKSANILLDQHFEAKVCDFGQARMATGGSENGEYTHYTLKQKRDMFIASKAYLPPEFADDFQISIKGDTYSFGIVICECCTGEHAEDEKRQGGELLRNYIDNSCGMENLSMPSHYDQSIHDKYKQLCDKRIQDVWMATEWYDLFLIGRDCITERKKHRPLMADVLKRLDELLKEMQMSQIKSVNGHVSAKVPYTVVPQRQLPASYPPFVNSTVQHLQGPQMSAMPQPFHDPRQFSYYNQPNVPVPTNPQYHRKSDPRFSFSFSKDTPQSPGSPQGNVQNIHSAITSPNYQYISPIELQSLYDRKQQELQSRVQQQPAKHNLESQFTKLAVSDNHCNNTAVGSTPKGKSEDSFDNPATEILTVTVLGPSPMPYDTIEVTPVSSVSVSERSVDDTIGIESLTESDIKIQNGNDQRSKDADDDIHDKSLPSFCFANNYSSCESSDNCSTGSDHTSMNGDIHDKSWPGYDEIHQKTWPVFMHRSLQEDDTNEYEYRGRGEIGHKTLSLDADIVRNCDRYRLYNKLNESNNRCHSDPGVSTGLNNYHKGWVMKKSTLSGPQAVSYPVRSPPIYTPQSK